MNSTCEIIQEKVGIPVIHIADVTGQKIKQKGIKTVALLGTKFTMENSFYKDRIHEKFEIKVVVPEPEERDYINMVIFDQLCNEIFLKESKARYIKIIDRLIKEEGAEGIILGCTEIPLLIKQEDVSVPVFNTTEIHSEAAFRYSLENK
ncbi:MAG: amino acid racemase [Bacteroidota bacterium]